MDKPETTNLWGGADPVSRTKNDPNRSYREDALVAEIERLRGIVVVAKAYALGYLQDEATDRDLCISGRQHELAQALCQLVKDIP